MNEIEQLSEYLERMNELIDDVNRNVPESQFKIDIITGLVKVLQRIIREMENINFNRQQK